MKAIDAKTVEAFAPPERGKVVRQIGINPRRLREMVERNEVIGKQSLAKRRQRSIKKR